MNERILTIVNKNSNQQKIEFTLPGMYKITKAKDLVSGKEFDVKDNKIVTGC